MGAMPRDQHYRDHRYGCLDSSVGLWTQHEPARIEMNAVILPNGKVLAAGGSLNDEDTTTTDYNADLYDPVHNTFPRPTVNLGVTGLPKAPNASFNPKSVLGSGTSTLTITANRPAPVGTYGLTITGTGGGLKHSMTVNLSIQ
jgi:hypothetical protein